MFPCAGDQKSSCRGGVYGLSALRNLVLTKFNDRQVSLYYKIGYYSVISYMYLIWYTYQSFSFFPVFLCRIWSSDSLFKSPNPQDWRLEVPTKSPAVGVGVRACRAPAVGPPVRTWGKRRPRGGSCCPEAKALSSGRGSEVEKTRPPSWTWETFLHLEGTAGSVCCRLRCYFRCSPWKWQQRGNLEKNALSLVDDIISARRALRKRLY